MICDLANNPIDPSAVSFLAFRSTAAEPFKHDIYLMLIQSLRDADQAEGGELILRWLAAAQSEFEDTYERIQALRQLYDVERTSFAALKLVKWLVGLTSSLDYLTSNLSEAELRRLVSLAVRTWKTKGTEAGIQEVLEAVTVREVRIVNYFLLRVLIDSAELGFEEVPGVDPWLLDPPGMSPGMIPDDVTVVGPGTIYFYLDSLLGAGEAVPHRIRATCLTSRVTATLTSYWDPVAERNMAVTPSEALGMNPGEEPLGEESYRVGVDPDEYCSDLRIADNGGDLNRELVENLLRVLRSANERIFVRYVTFLDSFRRTFDWEVVSGDADAGEGEVELYSASSETVIRVDRVDSDAWADYYALARFKLGYNVAGRWGELRFYHRDPGFFYALRLTATGGVGATVTVDRMYASVRTTILTVSLPVFHFDLDYTFAVDVTPGSGGGNLIQVELDGKHLGEVTDSLLAGGRLELAASTAQRLTATYVELFRHPLETVRIGPEMPTGGGGELPS